MLKFDLSLAVLAVSSRSRSRTRVEPTFRYSLLALEGLPGCSCDPTGPRRPGTAKSMQPCLGSQIPVSAMFLPKLIVPAEVLSTAQRVTDIARRSVSRSVSRSPRCRSYVRGIAQEVNRETGGTL